MVYHFQKAEGVVERRDEEMRRLCKVLDIVTESLWGLVYLLMFAIGVCAYVNV